MEYQLEISKNLSADLLVVAKASAILISRSGYSERLGGGEVKNSGFDLSLWRKVNQNLALYIRGEAYLKYLAGVEHSHTTGKLLSILIILLHR